MSKLDYLESFLSDWEDDSGKWFLVILLILVLS